MMVTLTSKINIGEYIFNGLVDCKINSSWDNLTDTCELTIPRKVKWNGRYIVFGTDPIIKKGDKVTIDLGYDDKNHRCFTGYITRIEAKTPVTIFCEDSAFLLKQNNVTKSYRSVDLKVLLQELLSGLLLFHAPSVSLGQFRINKATPAKVLKHLRDKYFLKSFIRNEKLYCGLAYWAELQSHHTIDYNLHVVQDTLSYLKKEDIKIKLKIINITLENKKQEFEFGDTEGEIRTLHYYNKNEDEINHIGNQEIERLKYDGYRGSLTIFGIPNVQHGDTIKIIDSIFPEREGSYLVKSVSKNFGQSGYRQKIELESRV